MVAYAFSARNISSSSPTSWFITLFNISGYSANRCRGSNKPEIKSKFSHRGSLSIRWTASWKRGFDILWWNYNDVITGAMASQITSLTIVCPIVYSGWYQRKPQSSASLAFVKMFPFDDVIMETTQIARFIWSQHGAHLGPVGPRWAPCWPHKLCSQGRLFIIIITVILKDYPWVLIMRAVKDLAELVNTCRFIPL